MEGSWKRIGSIRILKMLRGSYIGSSAHKALIAGVKKETLLFIKQMTERYLVTREPITKKIIDEQYEFYKKL